MRKINSVHQFHDNDCLTVVVLGASGDLAKKKTYPSFFELFTNHFLPSKLSIFGCARTKKTDASFCDDIRPSLLGKSPSAEKSADVERFLQCCKYVPIVYDDAETYRNLNVRIVERESELATDADAKMDRIFYFAIPSEIFLSCARHLKNNVRSSTGYNRLVLEKPFGRDYASANHMTNDIASEFDEAEIFRIDHYLGKEMVQNLLIMRFSNTFLEPLWSRNFVSSVMIVFKEDFGTEGRAGYFEQYGIIRDIMQNHLMQVLALIAMETPIRITGDDCGDLIRDAKLSVLRSMSTIRWEDVVIGQYVTNGKSPGYKEERDVNPNSLTPTFCTAVMHINNPRWDGVPFIMKAGKGLNERKAEIRIQFKSPPAVQYLFEHEECPRNELVISLQPVQSVYMKFNVKKPGLRSHPIQTELNLDYQSRMPQTSYVPDAYPRLILDVIRGKQATFVRSDELLEAWRIFTPLLDEIEENRYAPIPYQFGGRGPQESAELIAKYGYERNLEYLWSGKSSSK